MNVLNIIEAILYVELERQEKNAAIVSNKPDENNPILTMNDYMNVFIVAVMPY